MGLTALVAACTPPAGDGREAPEDEATADQSLSTPAPTGVTGEETPTADPVLVAGLEDALERARSGDLTIADVRAAHESGSGEGCVPVAEIYYCLLWEWSAVIPPPPADESPVGPGVSDGDMDFGEFFDQLTAAPEQEQRDTLIRDIEDAIAAAPKAVESI